MVWKTKWLVLWSLWAARLVRQPTVIRRLQSGAVLRGEVAVDGSHEKYLNIPYATTPFRFQAPGPEPTWSGIYEAIDDNVRCPQLIVTKTTGQEDCLILNVYVPLPTPATPLPVMVFIHGGGFKEGGGTQLLYGADYLVRHGVILVTINYRLNIYGFLCLGIKEAPGNAGLKDQVAALKWIKRNIRAFGGDPDNVTIFGESAGGASVSYHMLSPMSNGLFHKAILESGSSLSPWARQINPVKTASLLANTFGFNTEDPNEIYNVFKEKDLFELVASKIPKIPDLLTINQDLPFVPCIESLGNDEPFLTETPIDILRKGNYNKVPVITGFTDKEGYFIAALNDQENLSNINLEKSLPRDLNITSKFERQKIADDLQNMYLGGQQLSRGNILKLSEFLGDVYFKFPIVKEASYWLEFSGKPVYMYIFQYDGWRNIPKLHLGAPFWTAEGASHADDLFYLFNPFFFPLLYESETINRMTTMWTNFAKHGNPTPVPWKVHWQPTSQSSPVAVIIDGGNLRMTPLQSHRPTEIEYWRNVYSKYRSAK